MVFLRLGQLFLLALLPVLSSAQQKIFQVARAATYAQGYKSSIAFPNDWVGEKLGEGKYVTSITHGEINGVDQWLLFASDVPGLYAQRIRTSPYLPKEWIKENWDDGYAINAIGSNNEQWAIAMQKGTGFSSQSWATRSDRSSLRTYIREKWDEGYYITDLEYNGKVWLVVMSKTTRIFRQSYKISDTYPREWIEEKYDADHNLTTVAFGEGHWFLVMSKFKEQIPESTATRSGWARGKQWSREKWDDDRRIVAVEFQEATGPSPQETLARANRLMAAEKYEDAVGAYTDFLGIQPRHASALNQKAWALYKLGRCSEALTFARSSVLNDRDEFNSHTLGAIFLCLGKYDDAVREFKVATDLAGTEKPLYLIDQGKAELGRQNQAQGLQLIEQGAMRAQRAEDLQEWDYEMDHIDRFPTDFAYLTLISQVMSLGPAAKKGIADMEDLLNVRGKLDQTLAYASANQQKSMVYLFKGLFEWSFRENGLSGDAQKAINYLGLSIDYFDMDNEVELTGLYQQRARMIMGIDGREKALADLEDFRRRYPEHGSAIQQAKALLLENDQRSGTRN